ncbi:hypothetical protein FB192DRAFT_1364930 [Mucor lusitanicus]|uniref:C2H2-type domain-containing protein n=1 Tax=Mucor circinelloides f. lusitanicus TaxID=29924 RepID=A0A8H4BNY0_MUCCL|nr:hypothetical protein FB192DRAFT_1364930 [Mucor lusitanicus]
MSTHVTKADTSLFIKRSTQDMELNQPKQEHKPAAIHDDQNYDDMANDTPMEEPDDTNIKQEEPYKYWRHLKFTHYMVLKSAAAAAASKGQLPVPQDPDFYCRVCDIKHADKEAYNQHLGTVHNMYLRSRRDLNVMPEWNSPNNYCRACRHNYAGKYNYRWHCKRVHHMTAPAVKKDDTNTSSNIVPDLQDPNNYCQVCDFTYKTNKLYLLHCSRTHHIKPTIKTPDITIPYPKDPNHHCSPCNKTYLHASSFRKHLITTHKIAHLSTRSQRNKVPDVDDPNGYCCVCEKTYSTVHYYKVHVATFHATPIDPQNTQQQQQQQQQQQVLPDVDDPNFHCRSCQKTFLDQNRYRSHLRGAHKMKLISMRSSSHDDGDPDLLPDPLDPNLYCRVCKATSKTLKLFRRHCRHLHHMTLDPIPLPNPDAEIDVDSPECYCVKCDIYIKRTSTFTRHLRVKHQLKVDRKRGRP